MNENNEQNDDNTDMVVEGLGKDQEPTQEQDTFSREYVEELRRESAKHRVRANTADTLAKRLHTALVAADGRLQDATDLEFNPEHLDSEKALEDAITALLEAKPHLKARKATGDIGAGDRGDARNDTDLISIIRSLT